MKRLFPFILTGTLAVVLTACNSGPKSGRGLHLPEGNVENGKAAFVALKCNTCHRVQGVELPAPVATAPTNVVLGGAVASIQTYGQLVTSVINPSHGMAPGFKKGPTEEGKLSPMPEFNDTMTVHQLIDLVAFLQSRYELIEPNYRE